MIPKNFIPQKETKKFTEKLLEGKVGVFNETLEELLKGLETFLNGHISYGHAELIAVGIEYSKADLQQFCERLGDYEEHVGFHNAGFYLSALVNKVIGKGEEIRLKLPNTKKKLESVGNRMRQGKLIILGDVGDDAAYGMRGGELVIFGSTGCGVGCNMVAGKVHAYKIGGVSRWRERGEIYEAGSLVADQWSV